MPGKYLSLVFCTALFLSALLFASMTDAAVTLTARQKSIVPISAFTAKGEAGKLKIALEKGLQNGLTVNEAKEILIQLYAYAGFPRSLTALNTFIDLLDERKAKGIQDNQGKDASPLPAKISKRELGAKNQTSVIGGPASGRVYEFAPIMDVFLKEHLFGDIFGRDVLNFQDRELATVSALASLPAETQLRSHLSCALVVGLTEKQLKEFVSVLESSVGNTEAKLAEDSLKAVLKKQIKIRGEQKYD